jgi:hypothetical protein
MDPVILCGAIVAAQQIVAAASLILDNVPTLHEVRVDKKRRREAAPYKRNVCMHIGPPERMLQEDDSSTLLAILSPFRLLEGPY